MWEVASSGPRGQVPAEAHFPNFGDVAFTVKCGRLEVAKPYSAKPESVAQESAKPYFAKPTSGIC